MHQNTCIEDYNNLVHSVYTGPKQNPPWAQFLELIKKQTQSDIAVIAFGKQAQTDRINYIDGDARSDDTIPFLELSPFTGIPIGTVASLDDFLMETSLLLSEFHKICLSPINIEHMVGMNFYSDKDQFAYVRLGRASDKKNYTAYEKDLINLLYPHFHTASEIITETHSLHFQRDLFYEALACFGIGVVVTDSDLNIKGYNEKATDIVKHSRCISLERSKLHFSDQTIRKAIKTSLKNVWPKDEKRQFRIASGAEDLVLSIHPQHEGGADWETHDICFYFSDSSSQVNLSESGLTCIYGLTRTEAKIAKLLVNGMPLDKIIQIQNVTKNTAYTHIKSIFQKVGATQQSSLVSKLTASPVALC